MSESEIKESSIKLPETSIQSEIALTLMASENNFLGICPNLYY